MNAGRESEGDDLGLLRDSLDTLPSSIVTLDSDGTVIYVNATAEAMLPSIRRGTDFRSALEELTHDQKIDRLLVRREIVTFPGAPGGPELHWIVWDRPGQEGRLVLTVWDTDWNESMNERRAAFTMAASHELREPLTTLRGFSEILNMDTSNLAPEQAEAAAIIETTARHLAVLVEDVFDLSRNSFGELRLNLCDVDLAEVLRSVVSTLKPRVEALGQTLECEIEPGIPSIRADRARSTQMISNLINNASIHNPEGTTIEAEARIEGDRIAIEVRDDGEGLPFERAEDAFHSFRRGASATAGDRAGSGIGLSITKRMIQLHRGEVTVESTPGKGTVFTLLFPIDHDSALTPGEPGPV